MKERPILFTGAMVRALLAGDKTQTRRVVTPQPLLGTSHWEAAANDAGNWIGIGPSEATGGTRQTWGWAACPHGQTGDRLWVREKFVAFGYWEKRYSQKKKRDEWHFVDMTLDLGLAYRFDGAALSASRRNGPIPEWHNRPSIFMPRAASRIQLEIIDVRVERLQEISEADCIAEGIEPNWIGPLDKGPNGTGTEGWLGDEWRHYGHSVEGDPAYSALESYRSLWESINGAGSWDANPWVWVVEFEVVK